MSIPSRRPTLKMASGRVSLGAAVKLSFLSMSASDSAVDDVMAHQPFSRWTPLQRQQAIKRLLALKFFHEAGCDQQSMELLLPACQHQRLTAGDVIFRQGDKTVYFYVIVTGSVEFISAQKGRVVGVASAGDGFGELGFITGKPRGLTARAGPGTQVVLLDSDTYQKHLMQHAESRVRDTADELRAVAQLEGLAPAIYTRLAYFVVREVHRPGRRVHTQSSQATPPSSPSASASAAPPSSEAEADSIFIITRGSAELVVSHPDRTLFPRLAGGVSVCQYSAGQIFGDVAAFAPWQPADPLLSLCVRAVTELTVLRIAASNLRSSVPHETAAIFRDLARQRSQWQAAQLRKLLRVHSPSPATPPQSPSRRLESPKGASELSGGVRSLPGTPEASRRREMARSASSFIRLEVRRTLWLTCAAPSPRRGVSLGAGPPAADEQRAVHQPGAVVPAALAPLSRRRGDRRRGQAGQPFAALRPKGRLSPIATRLGHGAPPRPRPVVHAAGAISEAPREEATDAPPAGGEPAARQKAPLSTEQLAAASLASPKPCLAAPAPRLTHGRPQSAPMPPLGRTVGLSRSSCGLRVRGNRASMGGSPYQDQYYTALSHVSQLPGDAPRRGKLIVGTTVSPARRSSTARPPPLPDTRKTSGPFLKVACVCRLSSSSTLASVYACGRPLRDEDAIAPARSPWHSQEHPGPLGLEFPRRQSKSRPPPSPTQRPGSAASPSRASRKLRSRSASTELFSCTGRRCTPVATYEEKGRTQVDDLDWSYDEVGLNPQADALMAAKFKRSRGLTTQTPTSVATDEASVAADEASMIGTEEFGPAGDEGRLPVREHRRIDVPTVRAESSASSVSSHPSSALNRSSSTVHIRMDILLPSTRSTGSTDAAVATVSSPALVNECQIDSRSSVGAVEAGASTLLHPALDELILEPTTNERDEAASISTGLWSSGLQDEASGSRCSSSIAASPAPNLSTQARAEAELLARESAENERVQMWRRRPQLRLDAGLIYISGLPPNGACEALIALIQERRVECSFACLVLDASGRISGDAYAQLPDRHQARRMLGHHDTYPSKKMLSNMRIVVPHLVCSQSSRVQFENDPRDKSVVIDMVHSWA
ncbi:hypothetical protein AB1Y20_005569 [Prymnesium parvum]|uniref:Cyclic nucleotide-binding domain-containing protein n=1 Tax=Prymnesium parvum TaxID=97485 RepID=A0AB34J4K8_PRYPA